MTEIDVLKLVCQRLEQTATPYMLTGSLAANFYAVPRMTRDIDIVIEIQRHHINKVLQVFEKDFYIDRDSIADAIQHQSMFNIIHHNSVFKIDFIVRKDSPYRLTEFERRQHIQVDNISISIVAPEDLIISKLHWAKDSNSELQLKDIRNLLRSSKNLDKNYMKTWIHKLDLTSIYNKVLENG